MAIIEIGQAELQELTQRQRYSHYFALIFGVVGFIIGINLRDSTLNATTLYTDTRAGIRAFYPQNWLLDANSQDYIFRVRDVTQTGFDTTIQVSARPIGTDTTARNVLEALSLSRTQRLAAYSIFSIEPYVIPERPPATAMAYAFVATTADPFLESVPTVVRGLDVLTFSRGQAIIITFRSDAQTYDQNFPIFEQFLDRLEF